MLTGYHILKYAKLKNSMEDFHRRRLYERGDRNKKYEKDKREDNNDKKDISDKFF